MWFRSMFDLLTQSPRRRKQLAASRNQRVRRLFLEGLEDRRLLALVPAASYAVGGAPETIIAADLNNDTLLDLATANNGSGNVSVLLGNADGTFQPAQTSPTGAGPLSLAVGDFDEDGKLDLVTANGSEVSLLKGNGLGGFAAPANIGAGSSPTSVAVGDFNADGNLDLGVGGHTSYYIPPWSGCGYNGCYGGGGYWVHQPSLSVLMGNGTGGFGAANFYQLAGSGPTTAVVTADFNGDGVADLASGSSEYGVGVQVLLGSGSGTLGTPIYSNGPLARTLAAADVNGDGKSDLVAANVVSGGVSVLLGTGLGTFGYESARIYSVGASASSAAAADVNGDGRTDIVTANSDGSVSVLLGTGLAAGASAFKPPLIITGAGSSLGALVVGNFNGDARADLAATNPNANSVAALLNDGVWTALDAPSITISDAASVTEGNSGTVNANFTVSLSAPSNQEVRVHYATVGGSATDGADYESKSETLIFAPWESSKVISIPVSGDRIGESTESFTVKLSESVNAFVADATGTGTIVDDEPIVNIEGYFSDVEGNTGTKAFTFTVSLSNEYDQPVTVDYSTADLTPDEQWWYGPGATAGVDYVAKSGTVTFAAHQTTSETITVLVNGDRIGESDELFFVNLSNPIGARLGTAQATGAIANDEPYVWIESAASTPEGNVGQTAMTFTLRLSAEYDEPVTVTYDTVEGDAVAGSDFVGVTGGTATIPAHTTSQTFSVLINGDTLAEANEYLAVNVTGVSGAQLSGGWAYGYILDDDTPPTIAIYDSSVAEGGSGTTAKMYFTVYLSQVSGQDVWVNYTTANSSAKVSDNDYVAQSGTLHFAPGETSKTIEIVVKGDTRKEQNERFYVNLSGASGGTISDSQGAGTILNDDSGGKGNGKGPQSKAFAAAVDAAFNDWMTSARKKRGR